MGSITVFSIVKNDLQMQKLLIVNFKVDFSCFNHESFYVIDCHFFYYVLDLKLVYDYETMKPIFEKVHKNKITFKKGIDPIVIQ